MKKLLYLLAFAILACVVLVTYDGCSTSVVSTASTVNGALVATVDAAMTGWATYTQSHTVPAAQILAVSNAYVAYYNSELVLSNLTEVYVASPATNTQTLLLNAVAAINLSGTNIVNIITSFSK
jgi:hypothetical protein